ncbi:16S rRNA (cytosine(967)-C(5))-methyltransferase RsmB [Virgibacillus kimchii]
MSNYKLRDSILEILIRIERDTGYSHLLIDQEIKARGIPVKDQGLLTEIVYGTLQYKMRLDYYLKHFIKKKKKLEPWVGILLRMSLYQMVFLDRIPDHAIIHEAVDIAKSRGHKGIASLVNGVLRSAQRKGVPSTDLIENELERLAVETSHPEWLVRRWVKAYGYETAKEMCEANTTYKPISVRVQPLRMSREEAISSLTEQGYQVSPSSFSPQGIIIDEGNILNSNLFKEGLLTIQDQSSMLVAEMLRVTPGMRVLDACSAPGGKVTHIAEIMENEGKIHAYDLHKKKIKLIEQKAQELQLDIIQAEAKDARKLQEVHQRESFDRVLVDAPCSGLGVIRGKPEIKYHKEEKDIYRLAVIQLDILEQVAPLLMKNGLLVYSTCTVDKEENEEVVKQFLYNNPDFSVDHRFFDELPSMLKTSVGLSDYGLQIFPQLFETDGFFLTRFIRKK